MEFFLQFKLDCPLSNFLQSAIPSISFLFAEQELSKSKNDLFPVRARIAEKFTDISELLLKYSSDFVQGCGN